MRRGRLGTVAVQPYSEAPSFRVDRPAEVNGGTRKLGASELFRADFRVMILAEALREPKSKDPRSSN